MNKKQQEQHRRDTVNSVPHRVRIDINTHSDSYASILDNVWAAWDRSGHAGAPNGERPSAFLTTDQRGQPGVRMLWYRGVDGLWRDCSWLKPKSASAKSTEGKIVEACRNAIQPYLDEFALANNRASAVGYHVDHAVIPFSRILEDWLNTLTEAERVELGKCVGSKPGVTFNEALMGGRGGAGGATGKSQFIDTPSSEKYRSTWYQYHATKAQLQLLPAADNIRWGAKPHPLD